MKEHYVLLGHPLGHSMSPQIHKRLFELEGKSDAVYELYDIPPEALAEKADYLNSLNGYNVTIPYKLDIMKYIDGMNEADRVFGSVNCVSGRIGYNTDKDGFRRSLEAEGVPLSGKILLLGCGGVGRMIAKLIALEGAELTVAVLPGFEHTAQDVADEVAELKKQGAVSADSPEMRIIHTCDIDGDYDLLINATPVGMFPKSDACPVPEEVIARCKCVFDVIYNPDKTKLMQIAESHGIKAIGGMTMLVWQAVAAHEIWNGASFRESDIAALVEEMRAELRG